MSSKKHESLYSYSWDTLYRWLSKQITLISPLRNSEKYTNFNDNINKILCPLDQLSIICTTNDSTTKLINPIQFEQIQKEKLHIQYMLLEIRDIIHKRVLMP